MEAVGLAPGTAKIVRVPAVDVYDAFGIGRVCNADGPLAARFDPVGFGGQFGYYHDYQGRYLLGHRYYDSYTGRFVTRDPIGYKGGINLYGFVGNNPVNGSDPSGFSLAPVGGYPVDPRGPKWYPQNLSQARARAINNWYSLGDALQSAGGNTLEYIRHLDNVECGCSNTPQGSAGANQNAPMQMAGKASGGSSLPGGLKNASSGLKELFSEGSLKGRSIIGIRQTLLKNGFKMSKAKGNGLLFRSPGKAVEHVRIMSRNGGWDVRVQNEGGGWLDEFGNQVSQSASHGITVISK